MIYHITPFRFIKKSLGNKTMNKELSMGTGSIKGDDIIASICHDWL